MLKRLKARRGSATIEATISLTLFIFFIVTIYSILNFCRAQALVSEAINQTAKELSQYSYFYKLSGLQKYEIALNDKASGTKKSIDDMISATDSVYTAIGEGSNTMTGDVNSILQSKNALQAFLASETAAGDAQDVYTDIDGKINDFNNQFKTLFSDPKGLMIGMAAIAGQQSIETAKSRLIAAPLARLLTEKYFELPSKSADERLRGLGVVDGYEGLNFNLSTIFAKGSPQIQITVVYKVKTIQLLPVKSEAVFCQTAYTRGWLSGDVPPKLIEKVVPEVTAAAGGTGSGTGTGTGTGSTGGQTGSTGGQTGGTGGETGNTGGAAGGIISGGSDNDDGVDNSKLLGPDGKFIDPEIEDAYQNYVARKKDAGEEPRERLNWKEASDMWKTNREAGRAYEIEKFAEFRQRVNEAQEQITIVTINNEGKEVRTRVDAIGIDKETGRVIIEEYKASQTAPLTDNQIAAFELLKTSGGVVVGDGKGIFTEGYKIPSGTTVTIVRKGG